MFREVLHGPSQLGRFVATTDGEFEQACRPLGRLHALFRDETQRVHCIGKSAAIQDISYSAMHVDQPHVVDIDALDNYTLSFQIAGAASWQIGKDHGEISRNMAGLGLPGDHAIIERSAGVEMFTLRVKPAALMEKVSSIIGEKAPQRINFRRQASLERPEMASMARTMKFLIMEHEALNSGGRSIVLTELEQAVMVLMLFANRHDFERALERGQPNVAPWQVHRAEEYIKANWDQPVTIEVLAKVTGASARSLFQTFRDSRGYSPIAFAKKMRLMRAREQLQSGSDSLMVTDVALACGFGNLGHFAKDYAAAFGEKPSVTLANAKARLSATRHR